MPDQTAEEAKEILRTYPSDELQLIAALATSTGTEIARQVLYERLLTRLKADDFQIYNKLIQEYLQ